MNKKSKGLLTVSTVLSFIFGGLALLSAFFAVFNVGGVKDFLRDYYINFIGVVDAADLNMQMSMTIVDLFVDAIFNIYAAVVYLRYARTKDVLIGAYRTIMYVGIFQLLFVVSIIPGLLAIFAARGLRLSENTIIEEAHKPMTENEEIALKVQVIRKQKEEGLITQEQFDRMLNEIIEDAAKKKDNENSN